MWSKLKQENVQKASQLEQKCLSLRVGEHLACLCVCARVWGSGALNLLRASGSIGGRSADSRYFTSSGPSASS